MSWPNLVGQRQRNVASRTDVLKFLHAGNWKTEALKSAANLAK